MEAWLARATGLADRAALNIQDLDREVFGFLG
jgi:hypothetical protein